MCLNRLAGLILLSLLAACSQEQPAATESAQSDDWVLTNGKIYTVDENQPWVEAVVIRDGEFAYVGDDAGAKAFAEAGATSTDLSGRMVIPGIVDSHTHPGLIGLYASDVFIEAETRDEFMEQLTAYANDNPGEGWIRVCCWPVGEFVDGDTGPDRNELDPIFPDRPAWLGSSAGHSFWLNSQALSALGIDEDSQDPRPPIAIYKRDDTGRLTGWVKEGAGWMRMDEVFDVDSAAHEQSVRGMLQMLSEHGVTTLYDAGNMDDSDRVYAFMSKLEDNGELPMRYEGTKMIAYPEQRQVAIDDMKRFRKAYGGELLQFNTIKLFMDGVHENRSGALLEPYADDPDYVSDTTLSIEELRDFLIELHEEKFDLHVHVIGDLASKRVLDAVEQAQAEVGPDFYPRVSMGHLQNVDPGDFARFGELGVSANFTPWWHGFDDPDPVGAGLGEARDNDTYRVRAISDAGGNVTFSSDDWTLDVLSPFLGMQNGHTRQYPREWLTEDNNPDDFRGPESERLPIDLLIRGYTLNGAYQLRMEDKVGSIETGKAADLVVLPVNLFDVDPYTIHTIKPDAVVREGELMQGSVD